MELSVGVKAAEVLAAELQRARSRREQTRVVSRILAGELERLDSQFLLAINTTPPVLPDTAGLAVPAWERHQRAVASLFDTTTWEAVKNAVVLPPQVVERLEEQRPSDEAVRGVLDSLHKINILAQMKLVAYTSKDGLRGWVRRAWHDDRIDRRNALLDEG